MHPQPLTIISRLSRWILAGSMATLIVAAPLNAAAAPALPGDELSWGIKPGGKESRTSFSYELESGETANDSFVVTNLGESEISLAIYPADGITASSGALDLLPADEPSTVIGAWVDVATPEIILSPGATQEIGFQVVVPDSTEPGDYVGGLVSSYVEAGGGGTVRVDRRLATQMSVRVGGEGKLSLEPTDLFISNAAAWNPFAPTTSTVSFTLTNTGTVRARGSYSLTTNGPFGLGKRSTDYSFDELIPGGIASVTQEINEVWPLFRLNTTVDLIPEGIDSIPGETISVVDTTWAVPWGQSVLLLLIISIAILIGISRGRRYENDGDGGTEDVL